MGWAELNIARSKRDRRRAAFTMCLGLRPTLSYKNDASATGRGRPLEMNFVAGVGIRTSIVICALQLRCPTTPLLAAIADAAPIHSQALSGASIIIEPQLRRYPVGHREA